MSRLHWSESVVVVLATVLHSESRADEKQPPPPKPVNAAAAKLIDKLVDVAETDTGYSPFISGTSFAPLPGSDQVTAMLLGQRPPARSDSFRELVKLGAAAVPDLVAHLHDTRPTRLTVRHNGFGLGGLSINKEDKNDEFNAYTLKVGDLCYVALGQIVNRPYTAVRYQPTAIIIVFTPTRDPKTRDQLKKEWGDLTPDRHRKSLLKDCEGKGDVATRAGAFQRLGWYYPDALEVPALQFLARPSHSFWQSSEFVSTQLYKEADANKRRIMFDAYVKQFGEAGRDGIREALYSDLRWLEAIEEKVLIPPDDDFGEKPRQLLIELYAAPKTVKSKDKPVPTSVSSGHVREVIESGLTYDRSVKVDRAVCNILSKTTDDALALACMERLVGRGFDAEIEAYYHRREKALNDREKDSFKEFLQKTGWTPLHVAIWRGERECITDLLREGAKVNAPNKAGQTPLHMAVSKDDTQTAKLLLKHGADPKAKDAHGQTPVDLASKHGDWDTVKELIGAGGSAPNILVAARLGNKEEVARFLGMDKQALREKDSQGLTPLHLSTQNGHLTVMRQLLDAGAEVDSQDENGATALHFAARLGRMDMCELLIQRKAKIDQPVVRSGYQPIHLAAYHGRLEVMKFLVEKGAMVDALDAYKATPLHYAAEQGRLAAVQWLVEHKADVNARDDDGQNALSKALGCHHQDVAEYLTKHGAKGKSD